MTRAGGVFVAVLAVVTAMVTTTAQAATASHPVTPIQHVVVIVQENHSFDSYFATYCHDHVDPHTKQPVCDGGPTTYPGTTTPPITLDDAANAAHDPNHFQSCQLAEIDGGKMDGYLTAPPSEGTCGTAGNYAYVTDDPSSPAAYYHQLAGKGALADHYFQSVAGASSSNDMYLWATRFTFKDNDIEPLAVGHQCSTTQTTQQLDDVTDPTAHRNLGKSLSDAGVTWAWYADGYAAMQAAGSSCPPTGGCGITLRTYPCVFDPSDIPAEYYRSSVDQPAHMRDYGQLATDITAGTLPSVVFVKAIGYETEHPGYGTTVSAGATFVHQTIDAIEQSKLAKNTLVLVTWDESGGFYDHVAPPATSSVDGEPYGPRVPLLAVGRFARAGAVSHRVLEQSSIAKFVEWNWLGRRTGQLDGRDATVNNLGSLLVPGLHVPA